MEPPTLATVTVIQTLPLEQRVVLILRDMLGWPAADVADLLCVSRASVDGALLQARASLAVREEPAR
jgi:RNA polymerase sigma-70 factor (ECF subfamily)